MKGYKCFDERLKNRYGTHFEVVKTYHVNTAIKYKNNRNGFHFCINLEDSLRYYDAMNNRVDICLVNGFGNLVEFEDEYNGYYDMYTSEYITILKILSRQEIISYILNLNEIRVKRFMSLFRLTQEEINLFTEKFKESPLIIDYISYYQKKDLQTFTRKYKILSEIVIKMHPK